MSQFLQFPLQPFLQEAIQRIGFTKPTAIQQAMIPIMLSGKSAIGQAHTGTGKSHSFLIPIVERVDVEKDYPQAVIAAPTRELADQLYTALNELTEGTDIRTAALIGGTDKVRMADRLKTAPHIIVGTPGRIRDMVMDGAVSVFKANILVIDEADLSFDMGFIEAIDQVASRMSNELEMYVFSATIPEKLKPFLTKYMQDPKHVQIGREQSLVEGMHYSLVPVRSAKKYDKLKDVMEAINPYLAIIFTNTREKADEVADALQKDGIDVGRIHGSLSPRERKRMMKQIRGLRYHYIVATDLAARGIDIPGVSHVINYEIPENIEFFVHRVGRTARAGLQGHAITLYDPEEEELVASVEALKLPLRHEDVRRGEWIELKPRQARQKRRAKTSDLDRRARAAVRKPKKVKPGYKQKMKRDMERFKRNERKKNRKR
ncbi:MAG TPA: DEAD/DEAH box helicase [Savagea sp.]